VTAEGTMLGTPHYMAPEQIRGAPTVDHRADLWALGVIAYRCLAGQLPFPGPALGELLLSIPSRPHRPLLEVAPEVPAELAALVERCLHKEPEGRWQSAVELLLALQPLGRQPAGPESTEVAITERMLSSQDALPTNESQPVQRTQSTQSTQPAKAAQPAQLAKAGSVAVAANADKAPVKVVVVPSQLAGRERTLPGVRVRGAPQPLEEGTSGGSSKRVKLDSGIEAVIIRAPKSEWRRVQSSRRTQFWLVLLGLALVGMALYLYAQMS
jgi:serine/threonine protein kinase